MAKKSSNNPTQNPTVAFRIPHWALEYYQDLAAKERRKLGQVLRIVLEDNAKPRSGRRKQEQAA